MHGLQRLSKFFATASLISAVVFMGVFWDWHWRNGWIVIPLIISSQGCHLPESCVSAPTLQAVCSRNIYPPFHFPCQVDRAGSRTLPKGEVRLVTLWEGVEGKAGAG